MGGKETSGVKFGPIQLLGKEPESLKVKSINYDDPTELHWTGPIQLRLISILETFRQAIQEAGSDAQGKNPGVKKEAKRYLDYNQ